MDLESDSFVTPKQANTIAGISKSERWRKEKAGDFPKSIILGPRCTRYSLKEVSAWVEARKAERSAQKPRNPIKRKSEAAAQPMGA